MARYGEARTEHTKVVNLIRKSKLDMGSNFGLDRLAQDITAGAKAGKNSERRRKDELMPAVDVCHIRDIYHSVNIDHGIVHRLKGCFFVCPVVKHFHYRPRYPTS